MAMTPADKRWYKIYRKYISSSILYPWTDEEAARRLSMINEEFQKQIPGNYKVIWDSETGIDINVIFDNDEAKTMWLLRFA